MIQIMINKLIEDALSGLDENTRVSVLLNAITGIGRPDHDVTPAHLVATFVKMGTFDDVGANLNWTELSLIVEAARSIGLVEWADGFEGRAQSTYDPEGYSDSN